MDSSDYEQLAELRAWLANELIDVQWSGVILTDDKTLVPVYVPETLAALLRQMYDAGDWRVTVAKR